MVEQNLVQLEPVERAVLAVRSQKVPDRQRPRRALRRSRQDAQSPGQRRRIGRGAVFKITIRDLERPTARS